MHFRAVVALPLADYGKGWCLAPEVGFGGNGATDGFGQERALALTLRLSGFAATRTLSVPKLTIAMRRLRR